MSGMETFPGTKPPARPYRIASNLTCPACGENNVTHLYRNRPWCPPCVDAEVKRDWGQYYAEHMRLAGRGPRGRR